MENLETKSGIFIESGSLAKSFMAQVFSYMFAALAISGVIAYWIGTDESLLQLVYGTFLRWIVMFAPFVLVWIMGARYHKLSPASMLIFFSLFAVLMGASLGFIFAVYAMGTIVNTFISCSLLFGTMAVVGYTTNTDLTKLGSLLMMALIGLVIASLINIFAGSSTLDYLISFAGVIIFTGLTAYDVQKLKRIGAGAEYGSASTVKLAMWGAIDLYLDFINLFLMLLRLFGGNNRD